MNHLRRNAFTLLELVVVVGIIVLLAALAFPVMAKLRARAQRIKCMANLRSLAVAANGYLNDNNQWPQIPVGSSSSPREVFAQAWITALAPFGTTRETWICPTIQSSLHNPDYSKPETARIDYIPTPFDDTPISPRQWPTQPWFVETGDVHGSGNLIIFTDGSIKDLKTVLAEQAGGK
ncbi:MAG: type II secretion system protein [Chthoniobacterales bacterium]